uniref:Uncharacterized protein n=1 Tax=Arundo donax TaxID=35708 RepID=A0A0A9B6D0_ARUDO
MDRSAASINCKRWQLVYKTRRYRRGRFRHV